MIRWAVGSLRRQVEREVRNHLRTNASLRAAAYPITVRFLRSIFTTESIWVWGGLYVAVLILATAVDAADAAYCHLASCPFHMPIQLGHTSSHQGTIFQITGYLIAAQVGVLAALSIAVSLVTLIGQNDNADADVGVYYYESLTLPLVASSAALLAVLCVQLVWPVQLIGNWVGFTTRSLAVQTTLTGLHILWMVVNLVAFTHFAITSLSFGQREARAESRYRYTASFIIPAHLKSQLLQAQFLQLSKSLRLQSASGGAAIWFWRFPVPLPTVEWLTFKQPSILDDVWERPLGWALRSWLKRVSKLEAAQNHTVLNFPFGFETSLTGSQALCRRRGGLPLSALELFLVRISFRFRPDK